MEAKAPEKPKDGNSRAQQAGISHRDGRASSSYVLSLSLVLQEYETLVEEHNLKLKQHSELSANVEEHGKYIESIGRSIGLDKGDAMNHSFGMQDAIKSGSSEKVLAAAREVLMDIRPRSICVCVALSHRIAH